MALNKGNAGCTTGLSQRLYDNWRLDTTNNGFSSPLSPAQATAVKSMCWAFAQAIVDEITTNAVVTDSGGTPTGDLVK